MRRSFDSRAAAATLAVALTAVACAESSQVALDVPAEVEVVASLELSGALVYAGSELTAWPKGQELPLVARAEVETTLVGYSIAALAEAGAIEQNGEPIGGALRAAAACEPLLPAPRFAASWPPGATLRSIDTASIPPLTTTELASRCPALDANAIHAELDCRDRGCELEVTAGDDCALSFDFTACEDRVVAGRVWPNGEICLDRTEAERMGCRIDVSAAASIEPPFVIEKRTVIAGASAVTPEFLRFNGLLLPELMFFGWVHDLALAGNYLLIAGGDGTARDVCAGAANLRGSLLALDSSTLEPVSTASVPPCLTRIAAVPGAPELVGVFADDRSYYLGRFSARAGEVGRLLGRREIRASSGVHRTMDLEVLPESNAVAILFNIAAESGKGGDGGNILAIHALDSLAEKSRTVFPRGQRWAMASGGAPGQLAIADHKNRALEWWNVDTGTAAPALQLPRPDGLTDDSLLDVVYDANARLYLGHGTRDPLLMLIAPQGPLLDRDYFFEAAVDPVTSASWASDQVLVAGMKQEPGGEFRAVVARYQLTERRFLPGTFELGPGISNKMVVGADGRVFALLPWSGEVARLTPQGMR